MHLRATRWQKNNPDKVKEIRARHLEKVKNSPEYKKARRAIEKKREQARKTKSLRRAQAIDRWVANNENKVLNRRAKKYGLTRKQFDALRKAQNYSCKICGTKESQLSRMLGVDHDHVSGVVRGLLCDDCNKGLGFFHDDVERLSEAIVYLSAQAQKKKKKRVVRVPKRALKVA